LTALLILVFVYQRFLGSHRVSTISSHSVSLRPALIGKWKYLASACLFILIGVGIYLPLGVLIVGSFMKFFGIFNIQAPFSTKHWLSVINDVAFFDAVKNSLFIGFVVATTGVAAYAFLAYSLRQPRLFGRTFISGLVWIPWAIPGVLLGLALAWIFITVPGLDLLHNTFAALIIALVIKEMPIGTQMIHAAFSQISEELVQASKVVGAGWFRTFVRIELPLIAPMLVSIFVIVFMASLRDVSTTILLVSPSTIPLSVLMLERYMSGGKEAASVIGVILSVLAILTAWGMRKLGFRVGGESV
jgi:iron(III) transport system permease protein